MSVPALKERSLAYAFLGTRLNRLLYNSKFPFHSFSSLTFTDQMIALHQIPRTHPHFTKNMHAAVTLLCADFPVQLSLTSLEIISLAKLAFPSSTYSRSPYAPRKTLPLAELTRVTFAKKYFPYKVHPLATTKTNVKYTDLVFSLAKNHTLIHYEQMIYALAGRVSDDQVCAAILYATGLAPHLGPYAYEFATCCVLSPKNAKGLSTALKALGANSDLVGSLLIEADTLQGRGVGTVDLRAEATYRCDPAGVHDSVLDVDQVALASAIEDILTEELKIVDPEFPTLEDFWQSRWLWCVNGSHSRILDRSGGLNTRKIFPGIDRVYRRMYAEAQEEEPISGWDGTVLVSASEKLEHGKTRAIFACDTLAYFAFQHFLATVEKIWKGVRVVLDPGSLGHLGVARRVLSFSDGGVHVMLDYDDFNSQHSNASMQTLFEVVTRVTSYPSELASKLISSFSKTEVFCRGEHIGKALGTLMSGHRATTFINSILNAAYIRMAIGKEAYERYKAIHVGDDIYLNVPSHSEAAHVLLAAKNLGCRMNPAKQSVGTVGAEFLRMGIRPKYSSGYFARSVASTVSGNWVTEAKQSPTDALRTAISNVRSLANRSRYESFGQLLSYPLSRLTRQPLQVITALLSGSKTLKGAPQFKTDGMIRSYEELPPPVDAISDLIPKEWPRHATTAYLTHKAEPLEQFAMQEIKRSASSAMLIASYNKALTGVDAYLFPRLVELPPRLPVGSESAVALLHRPASKGVLAAYPLLTLMKGALNTTLLRTLIEMAGGDRGAPDPHAEAWGPESQTSIVSGTLSYSDASSLVKKTHTGVVYTNYNVYM